MSKNKIFNHDILHCTNDAIVGKHLYCSRVLGMTEPDDLIQLHPDLEPQWSGIVEHYNRISLSHSDRPIWDVSFQKLKEYPDYDLSVFIFADAIHEDSPDDDWFRDRNRDWQNVVEFVNSKNNFIRLANELNVRVPQTICFENKQQLLKSSDLIFPCYLKPAISVDGVGISRCESDRELQEALDKIADSTPLQMQQEIIASNFLNLQYEVTPQGVEPLIATEQILEGFAHNGNRYPTVHQPWNLVEPMAQWMANKGMKEIFAFDVAVSDAEQAEYYAIECNPRFNGATYPTGIARKLNIMSWASENFQTRYTSLYDIDLTNLEYDSATGTGVIIVNWGSILVGKLGILVAGSLDEQAEIKKELQARL